MSKPNTALFSMVQLIDKLGHIPTISEFKEQTELSQTSYYRVRKEFYNYLVARENDVKEGGSAWDTFEDDVAEGLFDIIKAFNVNECFGVPAEKKRLYDSLMEFGNYELIGTTSNELGQWYNVRKVK